MLAFARKIIAWRRTLPQLTRGEIAFFDAPEPVLALRRSLPAWPLLPPSRREYERSFLRWGRS